MTHTIDTSFRLKKQENATRRRRAFWIRILAVLGLALVLAMAIAAYLTKDYWPVGDEDEELTAIEESDALPADAAVYVPAVLDLAGDPMWINISKGFDAETKSRTMPRPAELDATGIATEIAFLSDDMLSTSERFMTTIPSTQEDFAFFQAQRSQAPDATIVDDDTSSDEMEDLVPVESQGDVPSGTIDPVIDDTGAGWGETIDAGEADLPAFQKTQVENNTSVAVTTPETERYEATQDIFLKILSHRGLDSVALEAKFSESDAKLASDALKAVFKVETLEPGYVVALRGYSPRRGGSAFALMQVSIYAKSRYVGTLARNGVGVFVSGVDPWVRDDLFNYSGASDEGTHKRQYRLLDAIYSTAARNNVPTGVIGEAIMYLSRGEDLNAFASLKERLVLVYSDTGRGKDGASGKVLYAGVHGGDRIIQCFVFELANGDFACVSGDDRVRSAGGAAGMLTPVKGVLTSTFGPRKHPILKTVRIHKGVDWAAPTGTPIVAAFDGEIAFEGNGGGYGNVVRITHAGNRETRYAHMSRFEPGKPAGTPIKAGEIIGYIGTTGLSTGPHLHFELYQDGAAIDPLGRATVVVSAPAAAPAPSASSASPSSSDNSAVERLTDRIIHVESGGRANAKNPLSSATGLGQFIKSTWIRMMNTYRPDLAKSLSTADLLALRFDPTISREMVQNLAREGESYLKQRGHKITAGRLYLCHFLGMEGAHVVLSSNASSSLVDVLGSGVISANPFLTGKSAGYVVDWAERKMSGKARRLVVSQPSVAVAPEGLQTSPEFEKYKAAMSNIVTAMEGAL